MITESVFLFTIFYPGEAAITHMLQNKDSDPYRSVYNKNLPQGKCMKFVIGCTLKLVLTTCLNLLMLVSGL